MKNARYFCCTIDPTDAVCSGFCDEEYLSVANVTAKLTPIKARNPRTKRKKDCAMLIFLKRGQLIIKLRDEHCVSRFLRCIARFCYVDNRVRRIILFLIVRTESRI